MVLIVTGWSGYTNEERWSYSNISFDPNQKKDTTNKSFSEERNSFMRVRADVMSLNLKQVWVKDMAF